MPLQRYFLYEWLGPARSHRRYLRRAYDATDHLAAGRHNSGSASAGRKILLCGVGRAATAEYFCERLDGTVAPAEVTLFDLRPKVLDQARRRILRRGSRHRIEIRAGHALALPFADGTFDWIETDHFLQFFGPDELPRLAAEWQRVLKPRGRVTTRFFSPDTVTRKDRGHTAIWRFMSWLISAPCHLHATNTIVKVFERENFSVLTRPFPEWPHQRITSLVAGKNPA